MSVRNSAVPMAETLPDIAHAQAHFAALCRPGEVREVRILGHVPADGYGQPATVSGYFDNPDALAVALQKIAVDAMDGVYLTHNPVDPNLLARANNRLKRKPKHTTSDSDIRHLAALTLDFDPNRKAGISSTDDELGKALDVRDEFIGFVTTELGWPVPVVIMMSGNGGQVTWRIDLPADAGGTALIQVVLEAADAMFGRPEVSVDTTLANPSRIVKLSGTFARKGDSLPQRPHRRACSVFHPNTGTVTEAQLRALATLAPVPERRPKPRNGHASHVSNGAVYDVPALLLAAGIPYLVRDKGWGCVYELDICLSSDDHSDGAAILQFASGAVAYKCQHNRCAHVDWQHVKSRLGIAAWPAEHGDRSPVEQENQGHEAIGELHLQSETPPAEPQSTRGREAAPQSLRFMTAREFSEQTPEDTDWVLEPFIPAGGLTKIDGKPKAAGKTTFMTHMIAAVLTGADFLGKPTKQGPVVLLTEQGGTSFREALDRAGLLDRDDLYLATFRDIASLPWSEVVADAFAKAVEVGAVLLAVDTLPACARVRGDEENSAGKAREVLEPLQVGADTHGIGVVLSFHDRKGGGEVGESGRGSSAYAGGVDVIIQITKPGGNLKPTIRKIEALSRFAATPDELYVELTEAGYVSRGSDDNVVSAALAHALLEVLPDTEEAAKRIDNATLKDMETGEERITERGILDELTGRGIKPARSTLDLELKRWVSEGYAGQKGGGKKGSPHRYWLSATPPDAFLRSNPLSPSEERICADPVADAERVIVAEDATDLVSSDARPPSEEGNAAIDMATEEVPVRSSDARDGYIGSKQAPAPAAGTTWEVF